MKRKRTPAQRKPRSIKLTRAKVTMKKGESVKLFLGRRAARQAPVMGLVL
jgi:hypothetical protein